MKHPIHKFSKNFPREAREHVATRDVTEFSNVLASLPNPDPILRKAGKSVQVYRELTGDWEVFAAIELLTGGLHELEWELVPDPQTPEADLETLTAFIKDHWDIHQILSQTVEARLQGYQPFEFIWERVDGRWMIAHLAAKPPEWFLYSPENELRLRTRSNRVKGEPVHPHKFFVVRSRPSYQNPYGEAVLSRCFWPVAFKKGGMRWWVKFLEKFAIPWIVGKQPRGDWGPGSRSTGELLTMLENMVQDAIAVIPDDSSVEVKEPGGRSSSSDAQIRFINYCDTVINKVILSSETAMSVSKEGSDVRGDSAEHAKVSRSLIKATARMASSLMNRAIALIWHYNFAGRPPSLRVFEPKSVQKELADRDKILQTTGIRFTKKYYQDNYGLADDEFDLADPDPAGQLPFSHSPAVDIHRKGCRCRGCQRLPAPARFNQVADALREPVRGMDILDEMVEEAAGEEAGARNHRLTEQVLQPVIGMIQDSASYDEVMEALAGQFPDMNTAALEERLLSAMFLADTWARLNAEEEEETDEEEDE